MDGEIVARVERRRQWTLQEKAALMAEVEAAGGQVTAVARRHGISKSLLYNWRSAWRAAAGAASARAASAVSAGFVQLGIIAEASALNRRADVLVGYDTRGISRYYTNNRNFDARGINRNFDTRGINRNFDTRGIEWNFTIQRRNPQR